MWYQWRNLILWISPHILDQYFIQLCCWFQGQVWFSWLMCQNLNMCGIVFSLGINCLHVEIILSFYSGDSDESKRSASTTALGTLWFMVRQL